MGEQVILDRLHAFTGQWSSVLDGLLAHATKALVFGWIVSRRRLALQDATRGKELLEHGVVFGIVGLFGLFLRVQVVEISVELIESMHGRQILVPIAEVILADLRRHVTERFQ